MSKSEKALAICNSALLELRKELAKKEGAVAGKEQLLKFEGLLEVMTSQLETGRLPPVNERFLGMGRQIVDSWPLDSVLGGLLCSAEQAYKSVP